MMRFLKNRSVLYKFIITYGVAVIVVLLATIPIYNKALEISKRNSINESKYLLTMSSSEFEKNVLDIQNIHQNLPEVILHYMDINLYKGESLALEYYYKMWKAWQQFSGQFIGKEQFDESLLLFKNNNIAITKYRVYDSVYSCMENYLKYGEWDTNEFLDLLWSQSGYVNFIGSSPIGIQGLTDENRLILVTRAKGSSSILCTFFNVNRLLNSFNIPQLYSDAIFYVVDRNNNIILSNGDNDKIPLDLGDGVIERDYKGVPFTFITERMPGIHAQAVLGIPNYFFVKNVMPVKAVIIGYFIGAIILGIVISIIFAMQTYKPIKRLINIPTSSTYTDSEKRINEYEYIYNMIVNSDMANKVLKKKITDVESNLKSNYIIRVLFGLLHTEEDVRAAVDYLPQLNKPFRIGIIDTAPDRIFGKDDGDGDAILDATVLDYLEKNLPREYIIKCFHKNVIVAVYPETENNNARFEKVMGELNADVQSLYHSSIKVGLSEPCNEVTMGNRAYQQARLSLDGSDYSVIKHYSKPDGSVTGSIMELSQIRRLYELLHGGELDSIKDIIDRIVDNINSSVDGGYADHHKLRQSYYTIRYILDLVVSERGLEDIEISDFNETISIASLFSQLYNTCVRIVEKNIENLNSTNFRLKKNIIEFIQRNYTNCDIRAELAALEFNISEKYVYTLVKEATGSTFNEYVDNLRMNKALEMIKDTDETATRISEVCGFNSANTFYKAFKREFGVAPLRFRKDNLRSD